MLEYINYQLGLEAKIEKWTEAAKLPVYLRSGRKYFILSMMDISCLLIVCDSESFDLNAFDKHKAKLSEYYSGNIVLSFDRLTSYRRKALIERKISFIVPNSQIYLPFLGIALRERMPADAPFVDKFSPAMQMVFLLLLYEKASMTKTEIADRLSISKMTVSRCANELVSLGLVTVRKEGRSDHVSLSLTGKALYEAALQYIIDPVQKRVYVKSCAAVKRLPLAGMSALAERTMLNPPDVVCRTVYKRDFADLEDVEIVDAAWTSESYTELELWKYDPKPLMTDGRIDVVSLAASLKGSKDERVEQAIEDLMEDYEW